MLEEVLSPQAEADLLQIASYTKATWGDTQAKRYLMDIRARIQFALAYPNAGSSAYGLPDKYRKITAGSHRIIYRTTTTQLIVIRVVHGREDLSADWQDYD